jgi:hypothetical protein
MREISDAHASLIVEGALQSGYPLFTPTPGWINAGITKSIGDAFSNKKNIYNVISHKSLVTPKILYSGPSVKEAARIFILEVGNLAAVKSVAAHFKHEKNINKNLN